jgi:hypothetical protein
MELTSNAPYLIILGICLYPPCHSIVSREDLDCDFPKEYPLFS